MSQSKLLSMVLFAIAAMTSCARARGIPRPGFVEITAGDAFTCGRTREGRVACCGNGWHGELGNADLDDEGSAVSVRGIEDAVALGSGGFHVCAIRHDGSLWCWGENRWRQLGDPLIADHSTVPVAVAGVPHARRVSAGILHTCMVSVDGDAWCWGRNQNGQTGNGRPEEISAPARVVGVGSVTDIAVGAFHTCALASDGRVWCWGANDQGQSGHADRTPRIVPARVEGLDDVVELALGDSLSCARKRDGSVACWGARADGTPTEVPTPVAGIALATMIRAREDSACALIADGSVRCWGAGLGRVSGRVAGRTWVAFDAGTHASAMAVGGSHLCVTTNQGTLVCRGDDAHGQLCIGSSPPRRSTFPPPP